MKKQLLPLLVFSFCLVACQSSSSVRPISDEEIAIIILSPETQAYQQATQDMLQLVAEAVDFAEYSKILASRSTSSLSTDKEVLSKLAAFPNGTGLVEKTNAFESAQQQFKEGIEFNGMSKENQDKILIATFKDMAPKLAGMLKKISAEKRVDVQRYLESLQMEVARY